MRLITGIVVAIAVCGRPALAQTPDQNTDSPPPLQLSAAYEVHRDHLRYTFENPSNIDTAFLVPHEFTQRYIANNQWLVVAGRYAIRDDVMETEFTFTPERQTPGSDLDTFHDPNDDVVVSGTAGDVMLRSWRLTQWSEGRLFGLPWRVGYSFRRDRAQFLPADRIVTHSNPPSEVRSPTFGHETTISHVHELLIDVSQSRRPFPSWRLVARATMSPVVFARLITRLPDKYPGQDIIFDARAFGIGGAIELIREQRWPVAVSVRVGQTWGYRRSAQFRRDSLTAAASVRF